MVGVVLGILLISGAASAQVYFRQQRQIAALEEEIAERQRAIEDLDHQIEQWDDPAFVEQQARERFGWVLPGETGYRVIGEDGQPIEGATLEEERPDEGPVQADAPWLTLWGSTKAADRPAPGRGERPVGSEDPIGEDPAAGQPGSDAPTPDPDEEP